MDDSLDDLDTPNCPSCLEPMKPVVGAWWCEACGVSVRPRSTFAIRNDAAVIDGMNRLRELRKHESDIRDLPLRPE